MKKRRISKLTTFQKFVLCVTAAAAISILIVLVLNWSVDSTDLPLWERILHGSSLVGIGGAAYLRGVMDTHN